MKLIFILCSLQVPLPFSSFLDFCKKRTQKQSKHEQCLDLEHCHASQTHDDTQQPSLASEDVPEQIYLAQVQIPVVSREDYFYLFLIVFDKILAFINFSLKYC